VAQGAVPISLVQNFTAVSYPSKHTPGLERDRDRDHALIEAGGQSRRKSMVCDEILAG
jgi:hypothetical protein